MSEKSLFSEFSDKYLQKMRLRSQYLCGFPEGTVGMRRARSRALTHSKQYHQIQDITRRNEKSPFKGIDTSDE